MTCAELEILAADYIDGTLASEQRKSVEQHAAECTGCREFLQDASEGAALLARLPEADPPHELVTRIAFHAPAGRTRRPNETPGFLGRMVSKWLQPVLQPKFVMGMAMTIVSFAMLERCTGLHVQHIEAADLSPVHIWEGVEDKAIRMKDRAVKYYENIKLVYEVETRLREMDREREAEQTRLDGRQRHAEAAQPSGKTTPPQNEEKPK